MIFKKKYNFLLLILIFFLLVLISYIVNHHKNYTSNFSRLTQNINETYIKQEIKLYSQIDYLAYLLKSGKEKQLFNEKSFTENAIKNKLILFVYKADSLIYWNTNSVDMPELIRNNFKDETVYHLGNGWYEGLQRRINDYDVYGFLLIKYDYPYENEYLVNRFNRNISHEMQSSQIQTKSGEYNIYSKNQKFLFSIQYNTNPYTHFLVYLNLFLSTCSIVILIITLYLISQKFKHQKIIFTIGLIILRLISFIFKIPFAYYSTKLFTAYYYAGSSMVPSLGDMALNCILLLIIIITYADFFKKNFEFNKRITFYSAGIISFILSVFSFLLFILLVKSLIINSRITLNFQNLYDFSKHTLIILVIIAILSLFTYLTALFFVKNFLKRYSSLSVFIIYVVIFLIISIFYKLNGSNFFIYYLFYITIIFSIFYLIKNNEKFRNINIKAHFISILVFTIFITYLLYEFNNYKDFETRKLLAIRLSEERDPSIEYLFDDTSKKIKNDEYAKSLITKPLYNEADLNNYLLKKYFTRNWESYNVQIIVCSEEDNLEIKPENIRVNCREYFFNIIRNTGTAALAENLYYKRSGSVSNSYLGFIEIDSLMFFIEFDSKFIPKELGYPKLFIDKKLDISNIYSNYSYAKYKKGELIYQYGKYFYRNEIAEEFKRKDAKDFTISQRNRYNHLIYYTGNNIFLISSKNLSFYKKIAPFSYVLFSLILIFSLINIRNIRQLRIKGIAHFYNTFSLQRRILISIVIVVILSFISIGSMSVLYLNNNNEEKIRETIIDKTHSILVELENKLSGTDIIENDTLNISNEDLGAQLIKLSNIYFIDINIYDVNGRIISSSREKLYKEKLLSEYIDPIAFRNLVKDKRSLYIQKENINKLSYFSCYMPLHNFDNKIIAIINLPYFAKEYEFKNELSIFITSFINAYLIIIAFAIILLIVISNYITEPLSLIQDKISKIKLGKTNEKLEWSREDEIGNLIKEYNNMVNKLEESAGLLAKSERESAWREMAKQVAHEIKNPLTPMKLNIQHLERLSQTEENQELYKEKINKICKTLIGQIEMLSEIATQFGDFAKLPAIKPGRTELNTLINNVIELYKKEDNITISYNNSGLGNCFVNIEENQLLRVFNNLIKNAIQAIEMKSERNGVIELKLLQEENNYIIIISDNGIGIKESDQIKIFSPSFTTKSSGTGLGLALSKNILESAGGKIWFKSNYKAGTEFSFSIPLSE